MAQRVEFFLAVDNSQCAHFGLDLHFTEEASLACAVTTLAQPGYAVACGEMSKLIGMTSLDPASSPFAA